MTSDYQIGIEDFLSNNGFSAKYFINHVQHMIKQAKNKDIGLRYTLYRYKLVIEFKGNILTVKPHANGRSKKYATVFHGTKEVFTFRHDIKPKIVMNVIKSYFATL